mmetsp:Transcript_9887/g.30723  ORF Transcript_9887/g.30723 Transcript_9887/m.30723 type:complete len:190 (+) Transcript_9887:54-623(+)
MPRTVRTRPAVHATIVAAALGAAAAGAAGATCSAGGQSEDHCHVPSLLHVGATLSRRQGLVEDHPVAAHELSAQAEVGASHAGAGGLSLLARLIPTLGRVETDEGIVPLLFVTAGVLAVAVIVGSVIYCRWQASGAMASEDGAGAAGAWRPGGSPRPGELYERPAARGKGFSKGSPEAVRLAYQSSACC